MRLYHTPNTRSQRILWLLEEIGEPYDLVVLHGDERRGEEHRKRHPLGRVPVIEHEDGFVFESAAIALHLGDLNPESGLVPPPGTHERALVYQWTLFGAGELETPLIDRWRRSDAGDEEGENAATERFRQAAQVVEDALAGREYLVGDSFTVADLVIGGVLGFGRRAEVYGEMPNITAYLERIEGREARQRALELGAAPAPA